MTGDARKKLLNLVNRATSPTDREDEEARTAAVAACNLLVKHPELVAPESSVDGPHAPPPREESSSVHPDAERLRSWRAMLKEKRLREGHAASTMLCADCGVAIAAGEPVVERGEDNLATHLSCAAWWWKFQPPRKFDIAS